MPAAAFRRARTHAAAGLVVDAVASGAVLVAQVVAWVFARAYSTSWRASHDLITLAELYEQKFDGGGLQEGFWCCVAASGVTTLSILCTVSMWAQVRRARQELATALGGFTLVGEDAWQTAVAADAADEEQYCEDE